MEWLYELVALDGAAVHQKLADALTKLSGIELEGIRLEARVVTRKGECVRPEEVDHLAWRRIWARAIQAYRILMSAMARLPVQVQELGLFRETMKCSNPTNEFAEPLSRFEAGGFARVSEHIKSLSLRLSTTLPFKRPPQDKFFSLHDDDSAPKEIPNSELDTRARLRTAAKLIGGMSQLGSLDLRVFRPLGFFKADATLTSNNTPSEPLLRRFMCKWVVVVAKWKYPTKTEEREPRTIEVTYEPGIPNKVLAWEGDYGKGHMFREENGPLGAFA